MHQDTDKSLPLEAHSSSLRPQNENETDQSRAKPPVPARSSPSAYPLAGRSSRPSGRRRTFPLRLHTLLSDVEVRGQTDIVSWQPHGRSFAVHKTDEFVVKLLPAYFNQTKWSSFQRQLNLYSFARQSTGPDRGSYHHPDFLRGQPNLCQSIVRTKVKGTKVRVPSNAQTEPNFYREPALQQQQEPTGLSSQYGLAGHDRLLYPTLPMQMPLMANTQPQGAASAADNANNNNAALLQSVAAMDPQMLYAVHPYAAQAFLANALGFSSVAASMPSQEANPWMNGNMLTNVPLTSTTLNAAAAAAANANAASQAWIPTTIGIPSMETTSVSDSNSNHSGRPNNKMLAVPETNAPPTAADAAEAKEGTMDSKPSAVMNLGETMGNEHVSASRLPETFEGDDPVEEPTFAKEGGTKLSVDETSSMQDIYETMGQSESEGDIDRLPKEDQEWGKFLQRYFD